MSESEKSDAEKRDELATDETDQEESAEDQDSGPTGTASQVDVDEQRDKAEG